MAWEFVKVLMSDSQEIYTSLGELVIWDVYTIPEPVEISGGGTTGRSLSDLQPPKTDILRFRLEYNVDGIKTFITQDFFNVFGTVSKDVLKIITLVGIIKQLQSKEIAIEGISSKIIEGYLDLIGITANDLHIFIDIIGTKSQFIEQYEEVVGIKSQKIEQFEDIVGKISNEIVLSNNIEGIKEIVACLKLDMAGVKQIIEKYDYMVKGNKDLRALIISLMNLE